MRNFKEFIKVGNNVVFIPSYYNNWDWDVEPQVVTISYRPYYTDGRPDPQPKDYDVDCYVEISEAIDGESQISLSELYPIIPAKEKKNVLWQDERCKLVGEVGDCDDDFKVIIRENGEWSVVEGDYIDEERTISELSFDELKELRKQICGGSIFLSDYCNDLGIYADDVCDYYDEFWSYLVDKYGEENAEAHDNANEFANYFFN